MSLKLITQPFELAFSRNPMEFQVQSNNYIESDAIYPVMTITVGALAVNDFFKFTITDPVSLVKYVIKFTAVDEPDTSGSEFEKHMGYIGADVRFHASIDRAVNLNSVLLSFYNYERSGNNLIFTAKEDVGNFLNFHTNVPLLVSIAQVTLTKDIVYRKNHRVIFELWFEKTYLGENFEKVATLEDTVDRDGLAKFDIASIIDSEIESSASLNLPDLENDEFYINDSLRRYQVRFTELYTGNDTITKMEHSSVKYARLGGVTKEDFAKIDPIMYIQSCQKFLTLFDEKKNVHYMQRDWLSWMNTSNDEDTFDIQRTIYYTDGTDDGGSLIEKNKFLKKWETITFPVGYPQISPSDLDPLKTVFKWDYFVFKNGVTRVSSIQTYYLDVKFEHCKNQFAYINSYNQPEGLLTKGNFEESISVSSSKVDRSISDKYLIVNGQQYVFNKESNIAYGVTTGYYSQSDVRTIQDVLQSSMLYIVDNLDYLPALIDNGDFKITECFSFLNQLKFNIRKSFKDKSFSRNKRAPYIEPLYDCGVQVFNVIDNKIDISTYGNISVYDDEGTLVESVAYSAVDHAYELTTKLVAEGVYRYVVALIGLDGWPYNINLNFELKHESITIDHSLVAPIAFQIATDNATVQTLYYNYENGDGEQTAAISDSGVAISDTYTEAGAKTIRFHKACMSDIDDFQSENAAITSIDLSSAVNLTSLLLNNNSLSGTLDLTYNKKLDTISLADNNLTSLNIPILKVLTSLNLSNNSFSVSGVEDLIVELYSNVVYMENAVTLTLTGNPGAGGSLSSLADDIINGTGDYAGVGLIGLYGWTVNT